MGRCRRVYLDKQGIDRWKRRVAVAHLVIGGKSYVQAGKSIGVGTPIAKQDFFRAIRASEDTDLLFSPYRVAEGEWEERAGIRANRDFWLNKIGHLEKILAKIEKTLVEKEQVAEIWEAVCNKSAAPFLSSEEIEVVMRLGGHNTRAVCRLTEALVLKK